MATDPDPRAPSEAPEGADDFRALVERQVSGPLQESIAQTELPPARFVEEAVESEEAITAEVALQRETVDGLRQRVEREERRRVLRIGGVAAFAIALGLSTLDVVFGLPIWMMWAAAFSLVAGVAVPLFASQRSSGEETAGPSSSASTSSPLPLKDQLTAAIRDYEEALERAVQGWLADRANRELGEIYSTSLPELDPTGLAEIDDPEREITTKTRARLESQIDHMPGGSIGISGPRGAGKTTLLKRVTIEAWRQRPEKVAAAVVVDAPVEYDARDFVLHLFGRLCEAVLGPAGVEAMRSWEGGLGQPTSRSWFFRSIHSPFPPLLGPGLFAAGAVAYVALLDAQHKVDPADLVPWAIGAMAIGGFLSFLAGAPQILPFLRGPSLRRREGDDSATRAERHLRQIWFQRTFSSGWSGALKVPIGVEAGAEKSTQLAENQLSFPDVVLLYKEFVKGLARDGEVRIGIDELDKMDDERARRFLNEIKVIFRISRCFYLVSVSEDAMAYFERRGLPFRDVFDSSFDDVLRVGYLPYKDSRRLLRRRVVGLPIQFAALCHVLGGGLARDVIRAARDVCEHKRGETIAGVTDDICKRQLRSKCVAARVAVRRLSNPAHVILLSGWLSRMEDAAPDAATLLNRCRAFSKEFATPLGPAPASDPESLKEHREAVSIALEILTFAYFVVTLREFLSSLETEEATRTAIDGKIIDRLAEARQAFAINPGEAWEAISAIRADPLVRSSVEPLDPREAEATAF